MNLIDHLGRSSKSFLITLGLLIVAVLGAADYLAGPDVSFLVFYIAPIFLAAWFVGRRAGLLMCAASGLSWVVIAELTKGHYPTRVVPYWNVGVQLGFMLILTRITSALKRALEHERELARTDYLTGTINRRSFTELAGTEIKRARRHRRSFTVAYLDIDDFKLINDRFGHSAGDALLRAVAETIRANVRTIDMTARLGGDEFAVLLPETAGAAAEVVIRRLRRSLLETARANQWSVTFSIGVVTWDTPPVSVDAMIRAADRMMYAAKSSGKNSIRHQVWREPATAA